MATYAVEFRAESGAISALRTVSATSPERAACLVAPELGPCRGSEEYAVYRVRRARSRRLEGLYRIRDDGDGLAGVREPRRPRPDPGFLYAERQHPAT